MAPVRITSKTYEDLYTNDELFYGQASHRRCPGVMFLPHYRPWLTGNIIDVGCGNGDTVKLLRKLGYKADGLDFVNLDNGMFVEDLTQPLKLKKYTTSLCIDVLEHIEFNKIPAVLENLAKTKHQVITTHSEKSSLHIDNETDLHVTKLKVNVWEAILRYYFQVLFATVFSPFQALFLCSTEKEDYSGYFEQPPDTIEKIPEGRIK